MELSTLAVAVAAGMLAAFNPCGIALLPTYLAIFLGHDDRTGRSPVTRALYVGGAVTLGFLIVFGLAGIAVSALAVTFGDWLSVLTGLAGVVLLIAGVGMLMGREISIRLPRANLAVDGSPRGMVAYGVVYATVSLSCTLPIFLAVVVSVFSSDDSFFAGVGALLGYGVGMGLVLTILALAMAIFADGAAASIRRITPYLIKVSGVFLVLAGIYVIAYAWIEYRAFQGEIVEFAPVTWASDLSGAAGQAVRDAGTWTSLIVVVIAGLFLIAVATLFRKRRRSNISPLSYSAGEQPTSSDHRTESMVPDPKE